MHIFETKFWKLKRENGMNRMNWHCKEHTWEMMVNFGTQSTMLHHLLFTNVFRRRCQPWILHFSSEGAIFKTWYQKGFHLALLKRIIMSCNRPFVFNFYSASSFNFLPFTNKTRPLLHERVSYLFICVYSSCKSLIIKVV